MMIQIDDNNLFKQLVLNIKDANEITRFYRTRFSTLTQGKRA
jgi:hypothetical protein